MLCYNRYGYSISVPAGTVVALDGVNTGTLARINDVTTRNPRMPFLAHGLIGGKESNPPFGIKLSAGIIDKAMKGVAQPAPALPGPAPAFKHKQEQEIEGSLVLTTSA
jgi:hypothetical protein